MSRTGAASGSEFFVGTGTARRDEQRVLLNSFDVVADAVQSATKTVNIDTDLAPACLQHDREFQE